MFLWCPLAQAPQAGVAELVEHLLELSYESIHPEE